VGAAALSPAKGRRPGPSDARATILEVARRRFGDLGFAAATIRAIARDAGVDPALVLHYYGSKADLFAAAMRLPLPLAQSGELADLARRDPERLGEAVLRTVFAVWEDEAGLAAWLGLIRSAVADERAAAMLREFLADAIFHPIAEALDAPEADRRVALVATQIVGLGIARYVLRLEPVATATPEALIATIAPTLQRYLTGD